MVCNSVVWVPFLLGTVAHTELKLIWNAWMSLLDFPLLNRAISLLRIEIWFLFSAFSSLLPPFDCKEIYFLRFLPRTFKTLGGEGNEFSKDPWKFLNKRRRGQKTQFSSNAPNKIPPKRNFKRIFLSVRHKQSKIATNW